MASLVLYIASALGILALLLLGSYEALAFATGAPTITLLVRAWIRANPFFSMLIVLLIGALLGHFFI